MDISNENILLNYGFIIIQSVENKALELRELIEVIFKHKGQNFSFIIVYGPSVKFDESLLTQCIHAERNMRKSDCVEYLMEIYNYINKSEYENRCPEIEKTIVIDKSSCSMDLEDNSITQDYAV